jgi:hypothetical protein
MPKGVYARKPMAANIRARISATTKGRKKSAETRARMSAGKAGHAPSIGQWKGQNIGYSGVHYRTELALPMVCAHADSTCKGKLDAALRHDAPKDLLRDDDKRGLYYVGPVAAGYIRLCRSHHRRYDQAQEATL